MKFKKSIAAITMFALISSLAIPSAAATYKKINTVSVKIKADDEDPSELPSIDVTTSSKNYSVSDYEYTVGLEELYDDEYEDTYGGPGADDETSSTKKKTTSAKEKEPVTIEITLSASDEYRFATMTKKDIKVNGLDANCTKASRQDSGATLVLTVQLPGLKTRVGMVEEAGWKDSHTASWSEGLNGLTYLVRLYYEDRSIGSEYETEMQTFDFAPLMLKQGSYHYVVRTVTSDGEKSKKTESDYVTISDAEAEANKALYKLEYEQVTDMSQGPTGNRILLNGGWQKSGEKYWYRLNDGMYPQATWYMIDGDWYWFGADGYIITNQWKTWKGKDYYFGEDGRMLTNTTTPDGYKVDANGVKK